MIKQEIPPKNVSDETNSAKNNAEVKSKSETKGLDKTTEQTKDKTTDKVQELTNLLQRLQAEFENYKKRVDKDKQNFCKHANVEFVLKFLPILDSFELALKTNSENDDFVKGIELIYSQFFDILEKQGLKQIDALNKKFDPHFHEVLLQEESAQEPNMVIEILQKGYLFNDRLIRTAKVKLSKKK